MNGDIVGKIVYRDSFSSWVLNFICFTSVFSFHLSGQWGWVRQAEMLSDCLSCQLSREVNPVLSGWSCLVLGAAAAPKKQSALDLVALVWFFMFSMGLIAWGGHETRGLFILCPWCWSRTGTGRLGHLCQSPSPTCVHYTEMNMYSSTSNHPSTLTFNC